MKHRIFIAINLPDNIKTALGGSITDLKKKNKKAPIKWVDPRGIHLTLHFLGYLDDEMLEKIKSNTKAVIARERSDRSNLRLKLTILGGFPNLHQPRVIWVGGQEAGGTHHLTNLQKELGKMLESLGIKIDQRPWKIHLTLGRVKGNYALRAASHELSDLEFEVKSIELMESKLSRGGAQYTIIKSFLL